MVGDPLNILISRNPPPLEKSCVRHCTTHPQAKSRRESKTLTKVSFAVACSSVIRDLKHKSYQQWDASEEINGIAMKYLQNTYSVKVMKNIKFPKSSARPKEQ